MWSRVLLQKLTDIQPVQ